MNTDQFMGQIREGDMETLACLANFRDHSSRKSPYGNSYRNFQICLKSLTDHTSPTSNFQTFSHQLLRKSHLFFSGINRKTPGVQILQFGISPFSRGSGQESQGGGKGNGQKNQTDMASWPAVATLDSKQGDFF